MKEARKGYRRKVWEGAKGTKVIKERKRVRDEDTKEILW
jgi:hypothetical protein